MSSFDQEPLRVAYVVGALGCGGSERQLLLLLQEMARRQKSEWGRQSDEPGIEPHIIVWRYDLNDALCSDFNELPFPIHQVSRSGGHLGRLWSFLKIISEIRPKVVKSVSFYMNFPVALTFLIPSTRRRWGTFRSNYYSELHGSGVLRGLLCSLFPRRAYANSQVTVDILRTQVRWLRPSRVLYFSNGVDERKFSPSQETRKPTECIRLISVGTLKPGKRWFELFRLLREKDRLYPWGNWRLTLVGSGELEESLRKQAGELGLTEKIDFVGHQDCVEQWLQKSDIFVFYSAFEGQPNVVLEAMSCGLPVLSTPVGDLKSVIKHRQNGFLAEDFGDFVSLLQELMTDSGLREKIGQQARHTIETQASASDCLEREEAKLKESVY